ncbi:MAG: hypothetical protein IPM24_08045 [Bryobacterales bacterium]|nr:hypothetical protein [Bryobacterales bacterium]
MDVVVHEAVGVDLDFEGCGGGGEPVEVAAFIEAVAEEQAAVDAASHDVVRHAAEDRTSGPGHTHV